MRILTIIISIFIAFSALAEEKKADISELLQKNKADITKIEKYLNNIETLAAPFEQEAEGELSSGIFYLSRPGKLRWDYFPPTPVLIVAKGSLVAYYDKELDQVSHISVDDTLAGFLTRKRISFSDNGIKIIDFKKENGEIKITITQNEKEEQGNLTMVFDSANTNLLRMEVVDTIGKTTIVSFTTLVYNKPLEKELFKMPRVKRKN